MRVLDHGETVEFPGRDPDKALVVARSDFDGDLLLVVKVPGGKVWDGLYQPWAYYRAEYKVLLFDNIGPADATEMIAFPVRTPTQTIRRAAAQPPKS